MRAAIELLADLIEEVDEKAYDIMPVQSDYFGKGVAEQMVLDKKKEISDELYKIADKYNDLYNKLECVYIEYSVPKVRKYYKKQIRGMINLPCLPGFNYSPIPYTDWIDEDDVTEELKDRWSKEIKYKDFLNSLSLEERFVEL